MADLNRYTRITLDGNRQIKIKNYLLYFGENSFHFSGDEGDGINFVDARGDFTIFSDYVGSGGNIYGQDVNVQWAKIEVNVD